MFRSSSDTSSVTSSPAHAAAATAASPAHREDSDYNGQSQVLEQAYSLLCRKFPEPMCLYCF